MAHPMSEETKARARQLMKERWADPEQRKILLRGVRKGAKKGRAIQAKARRAAKRAAAPRTLRALANDTPYWQKDKHYKKGMSRQQWNGARTLAERKELERYRAAKNHEPASINVGALRERWGNLIIQELHAHIVTQIGDAATLAGIKPADLTRRLIRQLQK